MIDFKQKIAEQISKTTNIPQEQIIEYIEIPADEKMGDFSFPCFKLAKELKKAPQMIAQEIKDNIEFEDGFMQSIEVVNGYLNFYIMPQEYISNVLTEIANKKENYGESTVGKGKNIVIDYSAPNIAKPFHIGHLRSTVIGNAIYKTYKHLGYNCTGVNHLGDYGTQFGKLIEGYKRWGNEYNVEENPIDELTKIYVRINNLCKEDDQDDDGDGSGDRAAVLREAMGTQVVAHDIERARHQAENQQHLTVQKEHHQRRNVGGKVNGLRDTGGGLELQMSHAGEQQHQERTRAGTVEAIVYAHAKRHQRAKRRGTFRRKRLFILFAEALRPHHVDGRDRQHRQQEHA